MCLIGNMELLCTQCRGIGPHLAARGSLMGFLDLRQEPGVYSRVPAGMAIQNSSFFKDVRTPVLLQWPTEESKLGLARQYEHFWR